MYILNIVSTSGDNELGLGRSLMQFHQRWALAGSSPSIIRMINNPCSAHNQTWSASHSLKNARSPPHTQAVPSRAHLKVCWAGFSLWGCCQPVCRALALSKREANTSQILTSQLELAKNGMQQWHSWPINDKASGHCSSQHKALHLPWAYTKVNTNFPLCTGHHEK